VLYQGDRAPPGAVTAVEPVGCAPTEAVMAGDDALGDVDGALAGGIPAILFQTGQYCPEDEGHITRSRAVVVPDMAAGRGLDPC
jgi:ribonucleotide monophosphatase NagD (HAD superfamily)